MKKFQPSIAAACAAATIVLAAPQAMAGPCSGGNVLILDSMVTGGCNSAEALAVVAAGGTVDLVTSATWAGMTQAQFAAYDAIVIGDPTCGFMDPVIAANACIWGPAADGNIIIIGTDNVFHLGQGGQALVDCGIQYALASPVNTTGAYITLTCAYGSAASGTPVPELAGLCAACPPNCFTVENAQCWNDVHIVATSPTLSSCGMTDSDLENWSCSVHEFFNTWPSDFIPLAIAEVAGGPYTASDGTVGYPYIMARGEELEPVGGCTANDVEIECTADGDYSVTFNVTNGTSTPASYLLLPTFAKIPNDNSVTVSPNVIPLVPPLAPGATTTTPVKVVLSGGEMGDQVCFNVILADAEVQECCHMQICVEIPKCCFLIEDKVFTNVVCTTDATGTVTVTFDWSFNLVNVSGEVLEHLFLIPQTPGITVTPSYIDLPTVPNGGSTPVAFTVSGATPGAPFSILISVHNAALEECCAELKTGIAPACATTLSDCCVCPHEAGCDNDACEATVCAIDPFCCNNSWDCICANEAATLCAPLCPTPVTWCPSDLNGDLVVGFADLTEVLLHWGQTEPRSQADLDQSGDVGFGDMTAILLEWGPC